MNSLATIAVAAAAGFALLLPSAAVGAFAFDDDAPVGPAFAHPLWAPMARQHDSERAALAACLDEPASCSDAQRRYRRLLRTASGRAPQEQLRLVDRFFDALADRGPAQAPERWHTLSQVLKTGGSDADIAIAKYYALRELGFATDALRVVVCTDAQDRAPRTGLAVRMGRDALWLGGATPAPGDAGSAYSINELFWWDAALFGGAPRDSKTL